MISRMPLPFQILLFAFLNLLLLAVAFLSFARFELRFNLSSFLLSSARDRVISISRQAALELPETPRAEWDQLLARYSNAYPAEFYLFSGEGAQLAGRSITLPTDFAKAIKRDSFSHMPRRHGPPRSSEEGPPPDGPGARPGDGPPHEMRAGMPPNLTADPGQPIGPPPGEEGPHRFRSRFGPPGQGLFELTKTTHPTQYWIGVHVPIWGGPGREPTNATLVWRFQSLWTQKFFFDYRPWLLGVLVVITLSIICWIPFIRSLIRSISQVTDATGQIADGHFEIELPTKRRDELGRLSKSINRMAQRLSGLVHGQRRFLSDIAHELCAPIARVQVAIGILEQRASEEQEEYVSTVREEVEQMSGLVNELLEFSKSQARTQPTSIGPVNVAETIRRVTDREGGEAVTLQVSVDPEMTVMANSEYLFRAIANVVRNSVRYAAPYGPISLTAAQSQDGVVITVADNGPGIPESELENVFRPFYRPELARQRETGGVGLGLAIVRSCIEACGGSVHCRNRSPKGLIVEMRLAAISALTQGRQELLV